jgi:hypothetical protein
MVEKRIFILLLSICYVVHIIEIILFRLGYAFDIFFSDYPIYSVQRSLFSVSILIIISYFLFYKTILFVFSYNLRSPFSKVLSIIIFTMLLVGMGIEYFRNPGVYFFSSKSFIIILLCFLGYLIVALLFYPGLSNPISTKLKYLLFIGLSGLMVYFSGQSVNMIHYGEHSDPGYEIWACFDYYNNERTFLVNQSVSIEKAHINNDNKPDFNYIYRSESKGDSITFGSYTDKFIFRDYYLSKDCRFRVLRGFWFLFSLPNDKKYVLKT